MINTPVVLIPDFNLLASNEFFDAGEVIYAVICDDIMDFDKLIPGIIHHNRIIRNPGSSFSIHLDFAKDTGIFAEEILRLKETLLHCFFHPAYKVIYNKPLICLNSDEAKKSGVPKMIVELENYVISQGFDGIVIAYFSEENIHSDNNINFRESQFSDAFLSAYAHLLKKKYYCAKYVGINDKGARETIHKLTEVENELLKNDPDHYHQLKEHQQLKYQVLQLNEKIVITEKELSDQKAYLKIFKDLDESTKIMNFYKHEYEILPLWYKKMGHIIKVLMGKRTFRSLFDNDVKKYKD